MGQGQDSSLTNQGGTGPHQPDYGLGWAGWQRGGVPPTWPGEGEGWSHTRVKTLFSLVYRYTSYVVGNNQGIFGFALVRHSLNIPTMKRVLHVNYFIFLFIVLPRFPLYN